MNEENSLISDHRSQQMLKKYIDAKGLKEKLKNLYLCSTGILKQPGVEPGVFLLQDDDDPETNKYFGTLCCRSAWSCPLCTARVMAKKGVDIACAIDALAKQNKSAVMITFTLPHTANMSCQESFDILRFTWRHFIRAGNREKTKRYYTLKLTHGEKNTTGGRAKLNGKAGDVQTYSNGKDVYGRMREQLNIKHVVRVYEFTWGKNSWHPHIHALFWADKDKVNKITDFEEELNERWWHCAKYQTEKYKDKKFADELYTDWRKEHPGITISKDQNNKPRIQKSSLYLSGWTGDVEMTHLHLKKAKNDHYTPHQMIQLAKEEPENKSKWLNLFLEYALTTVKRRRVEFSPGMKKIITEYKKSNDFIESYLKKNIQKPQKKWHLVYWFNEQQWSLICFLETQINVAIRAEILKRAPNIDELERFLIEIDPCLIQNKKHNHQSLIESVLNRPIIESILSVA